MSGGSIWYLPSSWLLGLQESAPTEDPATEGPDGGGPAPCKEYFLASDACAIVGHTRDVVYLNDGELVECTASGYKIHDTVRAARKAKRLLVPSGDNPAVAGGGVSQTLMSSAGRSPRNDGAEPGSPACPETSLDGLENPVVKLEMQLEEIEKGGGRGRERKAIWTSV